MKRKNKSKWNESKGGWIGAGVGFLVIFIPTSPFYNYGVLSWLIPIGGFLIGYLIQNKFLKKKR